MNKEEKLKKEYYMSEALKEAKKAYNKLEVPVGAIIVKDDKIIARAYNKKESANNCIMHAEIEAIKKASKVLNNWRLNDCEMYVTLEPCTMCAGAIINSRISKVYIGTMEENSGACGTKVNLLKNKKLNTNIEIEKNILKDECTKILKDFFKERRIKKIGR